MKLELTAKTRTLGECYEAAHILVGLGCPTLLGHNHVQEARDTVTAIRQAEGAELHPIGLLQSNRTNHAPGCVDAIGSADCPVLVKKINVRINREAPVFLEVNVSREETKCGCHPSEVDALVDAALGIECLRLRGFMTVGLNSLIEKDTRAAYAQLCSTCKQTEAATGLRGLKLSMGMSADLKWVIAEGANIVRVGIAVFGERRPHD